MRRSLLALVVAGLTLLAQAAAAQQTFTSLAGPWWFTISGKDRGAVVIQFSDPNGGMFEVEDVTLTGKSSFGFSRELAAFFLVAAGEPLALDSQRNIAGELQLTDPSDGSTVLGTLSIIKGKVNSTFTSMKLKATIDGGSGPVTVKMKGVRPPDAFPVLSGRTIQGSIKGKGVKSTALDLKVLSDGELGPPAYAWTAAGPVAIDKVETPNVTLQGHIMLTPTFRAFGLLEPPSDFGVGPVQGKLNVPDPNTPIPKLGLNAQADRKLKLKGQLTTPVDPVLQVSPTSFDFGAVRLDDPNATQTFLVKNVGVDLLSGTATFLSGSDFADFEIVGDPNYDSLDPNDPPAEIVVQFHPQTTGAKSASLRFGVKEGLGSFVVPLTGTGGVPSISVDPPDRLVFGTVAVGATSVKDIIVTNAGDATLSGAATLGTSTPALSFELVDGALTPLSVSYTIAPGGTATIHVRFKPSVTTAATGSVQFSGGGGATVALSGNAP